MIFKDKNFLKIKKVTIFSMIVIYFHVISNCNESGMKNQQGFIFKYFKYFLQNILKEVKNRSKRKTVTARA